MIGLLLEGMKERLSKDAFKDIQAMKDALGMIEKDLKRLSEQDPTFLDGKEGYIDYYSPYADVQMNNKQALLEKYINYFIEIQAHIQKIQTHTQKIQTKENEIKKIKDAGTFDMATVNKQNALDLLQKNKNELKTLTSELKTLKDSSLDSLKSRSEALKVTSDEKIGSIPIQSEIDRLKKLLNKHLALKANIPKGMLDVKRALSIQLSYDKERLRIKEKITNIYKKLPGLSEGKDKEELTGQLLLLKEQKKRWTSLRFSTDKSVDTKIKEMLEDLRVLMTTSIQGYQALATSGGDLDAFLHQTTGFYWENLYLYRSTLAAINEYIEHASDLTSEGKLVSECMGHALDDLTKALPRLKIENALAEVTKVDKDLTKKAELYDTVGFYKEPAIKLVTTFLEKQTPFFFIPYRSGFYTLDHPAGNDLADACGNCYGETHMFLSRINQKEPAFNNICPQTDLINFQLDQTRKAGPLSVDLGGFKAKKHGLIQMSRDPTKMNSDELTTLLEGSPSYALHGSTIYYIDSDFKVKMLKERVKGQKVLALFAGTVDKPFEAKPDSFSLITKVTGHTTVRVTWEDVKGLLTSEVKSGRNGDLCSITLSGARVEDHDREVSHVIGFIKMKDPNPYQYVVYDYGLGAMGFSNEEQLKAYFKTTLEEYVPFTQFSLKKIDEVSDECQAFVNGANSTGIKPLTIADTSTKCERRYWNRARLELLVKYSHGSDDDIKLLLKKVELLTAPKAKDAVYEAMFKNKKFNFTRLLETAIYSAIPVDGNPAALKKILEQPECIKEEFKNLKIKGSKQEISAKLAALVSEGKIPANGACHVFCRNEAVVRAALEKDPTSIQFADVGLVIKLISEKNIPRAEYPQLKDKAHILELVEEETISRMQAIFVYYSDRSMMTDLLSEKVKENKLPLARTAYELLIADIKKLSDGREEIPKLPSKPKLADFEAAIPTLITRLEKIHQEAQETKQKAEQDAAPLQKIENERLALIEMKIEAAREAALQAAQISPNVTTVSQEQIPQADEEIQSNSPEVQDIIPVQEDYPQTPLAISNEMTLLGLVSRYKENDDEQILADLKSWVEGQIKKGVSELVFLNEVNGLRQLIVSDLRQLTENPRKTVNLLLSQMNQGGWHMSSTVMVPSTLRQAKALREWAASNPTPSAYLHDVERPKMLTGQELSIKIGHDLRQVVSPERVIALGTPDQVKPLAASLQDKAKYSLDLQAVDCQSPPETSSPETSPYVARSETEKPLDYDDKDFLKLLIDFTRALDTFKQKVDQLKKGPMPYHNKEKYQEAIKATSDLYDNLLAHKVDFAQDQLLNKFRMACEKEFDNSTRNLIFAANRQASWLRFFTDPIERLKEGINKLFKNPVFTTGAPTDTAQKVLSLQLSFKESLRKIMPNNPDDSSSNSIIKGG